MLGEHMLWCEKYRPHKVADCILPKELKSTFQSYADKNEIPNMLLSGGAGMGKTTIARALCEQLDMDYIFLNASSERSIDVFRGKVSNYASSVSITGGRKVVILDEADNLTGDAQLAMRGIVEEFAVNCSFILTCNLKNRLIEGLRSRFPDITFKIPKGEAAQLAKEFFIAADKILKAENIKYDKESLMQLIIKFFPDFRRTIGELQRYSASGQIDSGILKQLDTSKLDIVVTCLREKNFKDLRTWVGQNMDNDSTQTMREVYNRLNEIVQPQFVPASVVLLGKYMYQASFVADQEVNLMALFSEMMLECQMKEKL